ncbi:LysR family transcriptional regulator [Ramlibacter sp.]|uniref:LysR family transcriptional regulator n=1 Tax=Ramlibacter sp. TaxID=1917967 RepID=UPI003D0E090D
MNLAMLSTLVAILDRGSFAQAAQEVGCTPSAVSLQVKQMEVYFGQPLFDRSARTVKPTDFALEAGAVAREFAARFEALRARPAVAVAGRVRLGAIATVQTDAMPQVLRTLQDRHPALSVHVSLNDSDVLLSELKAGRIDAAILVRPQAGGSSRLVWQNVVRQPFVMLLPPGVAAGTPQAMLQRFGLIRYDTTLTGGRIADQYVRRIFPRARPAMELRSIDAIVAMVSAGLGVSIVPQPRRPLLEAHGVAELPLGRNAPARQIAMVRRNADADSRNLEAVFSAVQAAFAGR